ncbi:dockerin type I repeat-containing protein [Ruminococcus difficilis]|uniref:Dockerin type I repeat-containing protein n=1 Tax=Ruminococcus difficilis TaxID=2763069 RepID=A0A934WTY8_9FIRM|nr:dockerin type I repeat-containing protein [Ruminococcus difficilis]MBK6089859.1 dockerin type I repeat-containing protein [Ruminococcus difficilis]
MLRFGKKLLAIVLSVLITVSVFGMSFSVSALETPQLAATAGDGSFGQYSTDELETDLLIPHTGSSSELEGSKALDLVQQGQEDYDENFISLSCDSSVYDSLNFDSAALTAQAKEYATNAQYQNPMAGFTFVNPNELLVSDTDHHDHYEAYINTYNDVEIGNASELNDDLIDLGRETEYTQWHDDSDDWDIQTSNGMGIDVDGDGLDELVYFSLCYKEKDPDKGSSIRVKLFDRVQDGEKYKWNQVDEYTTYMQSGDYVRDIPVGESRGYVPLAVGDYDGDGTQELAYYMPDKGNDSNAADARVIIEKFTKDGNGNFSHAKLKEFHLTDFTSDYGKMGDDWFLPTVALSTTSTRLGEDKQSSTGATQYQTHDDLVITVSVPRHYKDKNLDLNSITKIFGYDGSDFNELFRYEYLPFDENSMRMNYINSCDADLNGDGFKELVVAGLKEKDLQKPDGGEDINRSYGSFDQSHNYVNIITHNGTKYEMVWLTPMEVDAPGNLGIDHYSAIEPTAMCAGHYLYDSSGVKDQLCIQGVILDCQNAKVTGTPVYSESNPSGSTLYYITDTQPGHDDKNFPRDSVSFSKEYCYDLSEHVCADKDPEDSTMWLSTCTSGHFFNKSAVDQIAIVSSDPVDANDDNVYMDISIISDTDSDDEDHWSCKAYNDYFSKRDEDDYGTTLFVNFMNTEEDTFYYRWAGSYATYSAPVLYSVMQVPPYYPEVNSLYNYEFDITTGLSNYSGLNVGVGFALGYSESVEFKIGGLVGGEAETSIAAGLDFVFSHSCAHQRELTKSIMIDSPEDCVICYVIPVIVNVYEVVKTKDPDEVPEIVEFSEAQDPVFSSLTIDQYNTALETAIDGTQQTEDTLPPDTSAKMIDREKLAKSCYGDPSLYDHNLNDAIGRTTIGDVSDTDRGMVAVDVVNNEQEVMKGASLTFATENDNSGSVTGNFSLGVKFGFKANALIFQGGSSVTGNFTAQIGGTAGRTNSDGVTFTTIYNSPVRTLPDGAEFSGSDKDNMYTSVNSQIRHYDPENGTLYNYRATSVCYKMEGFEIDREGIDDDNVDMSANTDVFALSYFTENYELPPEQPEKFTIQSIEKNSDGSADITLMWKSKNRNPERMATGYNVYMSDSNTGSNLIHLQNKENVIEPDPNSDYTLYTVHLAKNTYTDEERFYLAPAKKQTQQDGTLIVTEGILTDSISTGSIEQNTNGDIKITKQPKTYWMAENTDDETATFGIDAVKTVDIDDTMDFCWQRYDEATDKWQTVKTDTVAQPNKTVDSEDVFHSEFSIAIDGEHKADYVDQGVRCVVICGNFSVTSDIVTMRYLSNKPYVLGDVDGDGEVTIIDVSWIQRALADMSVTACYNEAAGDVNNDGSTDITDVTFIQRYLAGMTVPYPINETVTPNQA